MVNLPALQSERFDPDRDISTVASQSSIPEGLRQFMTRRDMLWLLASGAPGVRAQQATGMASRGVGAHPRGKPSGLPFPARFPDIAAQAGLREPVIYGPDGSTDYTLESMEYGGAFFD